MTSKWVAGCWGRDDLTSPLFLLHNFNVPCWTICKMPVYRNLICFVNRKRYCDRHFIWNLIALVKRGEFILPSGIYKVMTMLVFVCRCQLYVQRYLRSTLQLPVTVSLSLPVVNSSEHTRLAQLSRHKLFVRFRHYPNYCLVSAHEILWCLLSRNHCHSK